MGRKSTRLFVINDLAQLRLTKDRQDIITIINAKKMQGEDVSEFIANAIRQAVGGVVVEQPPQSQLHPQPVPQPETPSLDLNQLVEKVISELSRKGMVVAQSGGTAQVSTPEELSDGNGVQEKQGVIQEGVLDAVKGLMNFNDEDEDD
ncbi:hypothetical protein A8L34_28180 [Bacillus sp. FJAT-27264]|uniref:hypothetical protein n=1 Tax=Paenibacillus sp. (strain DSM 101736 / FJAT-27264) TaxID=1850362 RepID=UPI000807FF53|nr:hypothetical protein [Bacillus sp. FJAT-27264]OBZ15927.1 hypothetical protein A8L34_28180 [Bacillus sp. FJAT-27264]